MKDLLLKAPLTRTVLLLMLAGLLLALILPKADFSEMENRVLDTVDLRAGQLDRQLENYLADHFPFHDALVQGQSSLAAALGRRLQNGVLIGSGGWLMEEPVREAGSAARSGVRVLNALQDAYPDLPFSVMLVPPSSHGTDHLPALYQAGDTGKALAELRAELRAEWIETGLKDPIDSYYYRTDHHLTAAGTRACYESLCRAWGLTPRAAEPYSAEGFLGSYWSKAPLLQTQPDVLTADLPSGVTLTVDGEKRDGLLNRDRLQGRNKYAALIDSVYGHAVLENPAAEGSLLIIGDSYANCLAPMLARHFGRIDLVDPRYFAQELPTLLRDAGTQRVLVYYGLNTFSQTRALAMLMP